MPSLRLSDIPQIERAGAAALPLAPRDAALLAWLAIEGPTPRDRLGSLLWPGSGAEQARTTLRQRLFRLKHAVGVDLAVGSPLLRLAPHVEHDLADSVEVLGDLALPDAPALDTWLQQQREQRRRRELESLRAQAQAFEDDGNVAAALAVAQALLRLEPLSETAHQRLIRTLHLSGERASAIAAFDTCEQMLKREFGAVPSPQTLALLALIEDVQASPPAGPLQMLPAAVQRPPRMVGRERELAALAQAWNAGQVSAVIGEAGMGKSRLLAEFLEQTENEGVVFAAGRPGDSGVPFSTLARLLRKVGGGPAAPLARLSQNQLARVLPELGLAHATFPEGRRLQLQQAITDYLGAATGLRGLALDDLHFADEASLDMLQSLVLDRGPLRWVLAYRQAELAGPLRSFESALAESVLLATVELAPLGEASLAELVNQLGLGLCGKDLAPALRQRSGGNPLFALETIKQAWVDQGLAQLRDGGELPRPASVGQLIERRVSRLSPQAQALARVASIAGVDFGIGLAESVLGTSAMHLADALNELEAAQILRGTQFAHDLVFDAVRRGVPDALAVHAHTRIAAWLEIHDGEPARVAQHWIAGQQPERAPPWLGQAAQRSRKALRNVESLDFLARKAEIEANAGRLDDAFATQLEAVQSGILLDADTERTEARLLGLARWARNDADRSRVALERAHLAMTRYDNPVAEALAAQALQAAQAAGAIEAEVECRLLLTLLEVRRARPVQALEHARSCATWIVTHGSLKLRCMLHAYLAMIHGNLGPLAVALDHHAQAVELTRQLGNAHDTATALNSHAQTLSRAGRSPEALPLSEEAARIDATHESAPVNATHTQLMLLAINTRLGRYTQALRAAGAARALLADSSMSPTLLHTVALFEAQCWIHLGQPARAQPLVEAGCAAAVDSAYHCGHYRRLRYQLYALRGVPDPVDLDAALAEFPEDSNDHLTMLALRALELPTSEGLALLLQVCARAEHHEFGPQLLLGHVCAARIACAVNPRHARDHALRVLALAPRLDLGNVCRSELYLHTSRALLEAGDAQQAMALLREGTQWLRQTTDLYVPAECRESFQHRNPVNAELAALASRHAP